MNRKHYSSFVGEQENKTGQLLREFLSKMADLIYHYEKELKKVQNDSVHRQDDVDHHFKGHRKQVNAEDHGVAEELGRLRNQYEYRLSRVQGQPEAEVKQQYQAPVSKKATSRYPTFYEDQQYSDESQHTNANKKLPIKTKFVGPQRDAARRISQEPAQTESNPTKPQQAPKSKSKKPEQPINSFMRYIKDIMPSVKQQHPQFKQNELSQIVSIMWHELPEQTRRPYVEAYNIDKDEYRLAMERYRQENPDEKIKKPRKRKAKE